MSNSVYKVIELVGSSSTSWEDAAKNAVETAGKTLKDLRIAEITKLDMKVENGKVTAYRARGKPLIQISIIKRINITASNDSMKMAQPNKKRQGLW